MTETKNPGEKTLTVTPTKKFTLKRSVEQEVVHQSFSHGRKKTVLVEKVRRRSVGPGGRGGGGAAAAATPGGAARGRARGQGAGACFADGGVTPGAGGGAGGKPTGGVAAQMDEGGRTGRRQALGGAKV